MQDLFCKLVGNDCFIAATNPVAYAMRMAANLAFDYRRMRRRIVRGEAGRDRPKVMETSTLLDLVRREELDHVLDALGQLPCDSRDIVVLRFLQGQDYATIGREFGKTSHQVRAQCHKAIVKLRILLDAERTNRAIAERPPK